MAHIPGKHTVGSANSTDLISHPMETGATTIRLGQGPESGAEGFFYLGLRVIWPLPPTIFSHVLNLKSI